MAIFLDGAVTMSCVAIAVFFIKYWRDSADRLFLCLAAAFCAFAVNYALLGILPLSDERRAYAFALRLAGFVAILTGILVKDRDLAEHVRSNERRTLR